MIAAWVAFTCLFGGVVFHFWPVYLPPLREKKEAAGILGISRKTLWEKLKLFETK